MELQKQIVHVDFTGGLDRKRDSKLVIPGKLLGLENGVWDSSNSLSKAGGYQNVVTSILGGGSLPACSVQLSYKDELLHLSTSGFALYAYASGADRWVSKGILPLATVSKRAVARNNATQSTFDCLKTSNVSVWVYEDSRGGIRTTVLDENTGVQYQSDASFSSTGVLPRLFMCNSLVCCVYQEGANILLRTLAPASPQTWNSSSTLKTDARGSAQRMDACPRNDSARFFVAYKRASDDTINVFDADTAGTVYTTVNKAEVPDNVIACAMFSGGNLAVLYSVATPAIKGEVYNTSLVSQGNGTLENTAAAIQQIGAIQSAESLQVYYEVTAAATYNRTVRTNSITAAAAVGTAALFARSVGLAAQPFTFNGDRHVPVVHESTLQSTFFVLGASGSVSGLVVARALSSLSGGLFTKPRLPQVIGSGGSTVTIPVTERGRLAFNAGKNVTPIGLSRLDLGDATTSYRERAVLADVLHVASACPSIYDGTGVVEAGFHLYPENVGVADLAAGVMGAGTYQYCVTYEWVDGQGRLWRSSPSVAVSITQAASRQTRVTIPTLRLTRKTSGRSEVSLVVWRTEASGTIFYRLNSAASPTQNSTTADTVTYDDNATDASIISNEVLYTVGGTLEHEAVPACRLMCVHQDRLFLAGLEDPLQIAYSKETVDQEGLGFNEVLRLRVPPDGGDITAIGSMDDKLVVHTKKGRIYFFTGQGLSAAGQPPGYSDAQLATSDAACKQGKSRSLVLTPAGQMFLSQKGIRLLTRGLELARDAEGLHVGAEMDVLATDCVAALHEEQKSQVLFYTGSTVLLWDYGFGQWATLTNHSAVDAVMHASIPYHLKSDGTAQKRDGTTTHNGTAFTMKAETAWLKLGGLQGFQRVRRFLCTGTFPASPVATLEVRYDGSAIYGASINVPASSQFRHHLATQKCGLVAFRIIGADALSNFALEVGLKKGARKLPAAQTA